MTSHLSVDLFGWYVLRGCFYYNYLVRILCTRPFRINEIFYEKMRIKSYNFESVKKELKAVRNIEDRLKVEID